MTSTISGYTRALGGYWPTARALTKSDIGAITLFLAMVSIPFRKRLFGRSPKRLRITPGDTTIDFFVRDGVDISVLREMFSDKEYDVRSVATEQPKHIADIGAHVGAAALFLHALYPEAAITAYEPDPGNFELLKKNVSAFKNIECVNAAVAATAGTITLFLHQGGSTRATLSRDPDTVGEIKVPAILFEDVVAKGVDFVKFDVEGAEYNFFSAAPLEVRMKVPMYVGEFHIELTGKKPADLEALFPGYSFTWKYDALVTMHRN